MPDSKKRGPYKAQYTQDQLEAAADLVEEKTLSIKKASKMSGVPRATLFDKLNERTTLEAKSGQAPVLTPAEETRLATYISNMADVGYPVTKFEILHQVKNIMDVDKRPYPFNNNLPGRGWFTNVLTRNASLTMGTLQDGQLSVTGESMCTKY